MRGAGRARQFVIDDPCESVERLSAGDQPAVDEKRRRAADTDAIAFLDILLDHGLILAAIQAGLKRNRVQPTSLANTLKSSGLELDGPAKSLS